jgi:hypothetical protein
MRKAKCPTCQKILQLEGKLKVQELTVCGNCGVVLEIVRRFPVKLDWIEDPISSPPRRMNKKMY